MRKGFNMQFEKLKSTILNILPIVVIMVIAILMRLMPHPPNFTPVIALGLFGVSMIRNKFLAISLPFTIMFISDAIIGFHSFVYVVYGALLLSSLVGIWLQKNMSEVNIIIASFTSSTLFFLVTNIAVWAKSGMYELSITGLLTCLNLAIPFYHNTIFSTMLYSAAMFFCMSVVNKVFVSKQHI